MRILYFDPVGGIAGDMTVAALLDLGVPLERLRDALVAVGLVDVALHTERASRHHIAGTRFVVSETSADPTAAPTPGPAPGEHRRKDLAHGHDVQVEISEHDPHSHAHAHDAEDAHSHHHDLGHGHPHRAYRDIRAMIAESPLPEDAKALSQRIFRRLAEAEGAVHDMPPDDVTFHEVGAWDSIADIVCTAVGIAWLRPDAIYCGPIPSGTGHVLAAHGRMPIPAPATLRLLEGFPVVHGGPAYERTTPTGAAIVAALARPMPEPFTFTPHRIGIGIGTKDSPEVPNLLRVVLGEADGTGSATSGPGRERVEVAEANLDDANPEWIGYLTERLLHAGALDVALHPVQMKKGRPGTLVQTIYPPALRETVLDVLFSESTTLGVRYSEWQRTVLEREPASVNTPYGTVVGKVATYRGQQRFAPEYESCRAAAAMHRVPLQEVYRAAQEAWSRHTRSE